LAPSLAVPLNWHRVWRVWRIVSFVASSKDRKDSGGAPPAASTAS